ncbi:MAG: hypothetical protein GX629_02200 [Phycisphaerae bacterium]|nr:hypothetical protein [Phycisphaerae bacterium]
MMQSSGTTRYRPVDNGYEIIGSRELFNRTLYGSHEQDAAAERYFTFAGDLPLVMGATSDWTKTSWCKYAKSGVLMSGLALTPGAKTPFFYTPDIDVSSKWFHDVEDVVAVFRNGWMEYRLRQLSPWMPEVQVAMTVLPLMPQDGFLVHYRITTDQRVIFCAGFGGLTDILGRFEYAQVKERNFHASDCVNNKVFCKNNRARITGPDGRSVWIGSSFPVTLATVDGASMEHHPPGLFLGNSDSKTSTPVVRMSRPIGPGETLDGFIVMVRSEDERVLNHWLGHPNPVKDLQCQIHLKNAAISLHTPDTMLNLTVPPTVLAMDASWHQNTFHHGAYAYHAPFLGWRNWYGPTVIGWHDRVKKAIKSHFAEIVKKAPGKEKAWYDGGTRPDLDHEGSQYHQIQNSTGFIPCILGSKDIYNMQEVALDMVFHHLQWRGDLKFTKELFDDLAGVLDWEERILDPDHDGLYQNFLNTWISDGHSYNGGGCAQASSYNYFANLIMAKIAEKIGRPNAVFKKRVEKIRNALMKNLWLPEKGLMAEFVDTIGNKLIHPEPELSTIYLAIDSQVVDPFQAYQMLTYTETALRNERTLNRKGRLVSCSNWLPKKYSTCGFFPAENLHLAQVYFQLGLKKKGLEILDAIIESYFIGKNPGMAPHILSAHGVGDYGDQDFSDVSSLYLKTLVEGLFGVRFRLLEGYIEIAPNLPDTWTSAQINVRDIALSYHRDGRKENLTLYCDQKATKKIKLPLRSTYLEGVFLNGLPVAYTIEPRINSCVLVVETALTGRLDLQVYHGDESTPVLTHPATIVQGNDLIVKTSHGALVEYRDPSGLLKQVTLDKTQLRGKVQSISGFRTIFVRVRQDEYDSWLAATLQVEDASSQTQIVIPPKNTARRFEPMDISKYFNGSLTQIHTLKYVSPRPKGYSIGLTIHGRYAWEWNHAGHNAIHVDDEALRKAGGLFRTPSGLGFATPPTGRNVACVSQWDNFPTAIKIPLHGKAAELALLFIGSTNAMQSWIENARLSVVYQDGSQENVSLVHLDNFDDWLMPALQKKNETVYFNDFNHAIVQRILLDPKKELKNLKLQAVANEIILGLLGVSIRRK